MDQNVIRTDLLPESMALWIIALLAVFGVAAWVVCHMAVKRFAANKLNVWFFLRLIAYGWVAMVLYI